MCYLIVLIIKLGIITQALLNIIINLQFKKNINVIFLVIWRRYPKVNVFKHVIVAFLNLKLEYKNYKTVTSRKTMGKI